MAVRDKNGRFAKGQSGNPAGRPHSELRRKLATGSDEVVQAVLEAAKEGDMAAARLVLERLVPPVRAAAEPLTFDYDDTAPLSDQARQIMKATSQGQIPPDQATSLLTGLANLARIVEVDDFERRLSDLDGCE